MNGAGFTSGKVGQAFSFNGSSNVTAPASVGNFGANDFSVDFWFNTTQSENVGSPITLLGNRFNQCSDGNFLGVRIYSGSTLFVELDQDGSHTNYSSVQTPFAVNDGRWHHVAIVRQGTTLTVFFDGTSAGSSSSPGITNINGANPFVIGQDSCTVGYVGALDELHIFGRALTTAEVNSIYNAGSAGISTLVGWWPFNEGSGTTTADLSGNGNAGTLTGNTLPAWTTDVLPSAYDPQYSLSFDGVTSAVTVNNGATSSALNFQTQVSMAAWVKPSSVPGGTYGIISKPQSTSGTGWTLRMESGDPDFGLNNRIVNCSVHATANPFTPGVWTHVAATYDSSTSTVQLFVNGASVPVDNQGCHGPLLVAATPLLIGEELVNGGLGRGFPGEIDDARVYNRILSPSEVAALAATSTPLSVTINASATTVSLGGPAPILTALTSGGAQPYTYIWNTGASTQSINASTATAGNFNYSVTAMDVNGRQAQASINVTVNASLTVTATSLSKFVGDPNPTLTYTITGFVNGDTAATALTGAPALTTTATTSSGSGSYPISISQGTLSAVNYTFTFVNGNLQVYPAEAAITAPVTAYLYAGTPNSSQELSGFQINSQTGALTQIPGATFSGADGTEALVADPLSRYVYATTNSSPANLLLFDQINQANGSLSGIGNIGSFITNSFHAAVDPSGRFLYVESHFTGSPQVLEFSINQQNGVPNLITGTPIPGQNPTAIVVHPSGKFLYVTDSTVGTVFGYSIDTNSGILTPMPTATLPPTFPGWGAAMDPLGRYLFVSDSSGGQSVAVFSIDQTTGALVQLSGSPFSVLQSAGSSTLLYDGFNIAGVTQSPSGPPTATKFTLATATQVNQIATYHFNNGAGANPGTITLKNQNGTIYGPFTAQGTNAQGQSATPFVDWIANVSLTLPAGTYTVADSDPSTWSFNTQSNNAGFVRVFGYGVAARALAIDPLGQFLFATNPVNNTTIALTINQATGALSTAAGPYTNGGAAAIVEPTGNFLYTDCGGSCGIAGFRINASGALTPVGTFSPVGGATVTLATALASYQTSTSIQSSLNPAIQGQPVTFTAQVTSNGSPVTFGTVTFSDFAAPISGPIALNSSGIATFTTNTLALGLHTINVSYSGNASYSASNASLVQTVTQTIAAQPPITLPATAQAEFTGGAHSGLADTYITPYTASQDGWITSWQTEFHGLDPVTGMAAVPSGVQLKIFRFTPGGFQVVAQGPVNDPRSLLQQRFSNYPNFSDTASLTTFNDPPIPVKAGDYIGIAIFADPNVGHYQYPMAGPAGTLKVPYSPALNQTISPFDPQTVSIPQPPALAFTLSPSAADNPLSLQNNYFVTGDFASGGVTLFGTGSGGAATGTITIPSYSPSQPQGVPDGADIIAARLYWQVLESSASPTGANATFRGYPISGQKIGKDIAFTETVGGATFSGMLRTYVADVNPYFPANAAGIRLASGSHTITVPDSGPNAMPLAEGGSLVVVYRVLSPQFPLKSVVIYEGSALVGNTPSVQVMQGFYDAAGFTQGNAQVETDDIFNSGGVWNNQLGTEMLASASQFDAVLNAGAHAAVVMSTPVNNSDNDGILNAWKAGPPTGDFHAGQPGYYDVKDGSWVPLPGATLGHKDLFVQIDYMCGAVLVNGTCDPTQENLFPAPDSSGNDPLSMVQQAFANHGVSLHLVIGNAVPEDTCTDNLSANPPQLCQFSPIPDPVTRVPKPASGVIGWKNSLLFSKVWPRNFASCLSGGDCSPRFPHGQKDSYHYVLFGHSLAVPQWTSRYGTITSIQVANGITTITTTDRGSGLQACPGRITVSGVLGNPGLNGVYNTTGCSGTTGMTIATPGVPNWTYPNTTLPEPLIGITSGNISSISGYSDLGGADSAVTLGLWLTSPNQDMSKKASVIAGTLFHEIGHTLGLSHGGLYYDTPGSFMPTFEANCKTNYQSSMNYLFQLDGIGLTHAIDFSNQALTTLNESTAGSTTRLVDSTSSPATYPTSAWYAPITSGVTASPATRHCDGTPLQGESDYRVDGPIGPITPAWSNGQDINFDGQLNTTMRGYNDWANIDLRQVGATGGQFDSLSGTLSFGGGSAPVNVGAGGNVTLGSGGTVTLGSGGNITLGSGGNVTLGSGGTIALGSGGNVTLGSGGTVTLGSGGTVTPGRDGNVTLGSGGNVTIGGAGTITLGSGGNVTLGSGGTVTLGSGGTITLGSSGNVVLGGAGSVTLGSGGIITPGNGGAAVNVPAGGSYIFDASGGTIALGSGGNVTLGSGGNVTLGSGGTIALGSGGTVALGSGGNVTLGSGGTIALGSGGNVTLGSGGNVTLGSGGTIALGSGGNVTLGSGGNVTLGSGGTITLGSGGTVTLGSGGNVTLGSGGTVTLGSGGNVALGSGGNVTLGSGGTVTLGSGGNVTLGSGGTVTLGSAGTIALGSGGTVVLGSAGNVTLGSGGTVTLGSGGTITLGSGGTVTLGSGGTITLGSGGAPTSVPAGTYTLGSGGTVTLGSGGNVTLGSGGNVTLGSGGTITLGSGGNVTLGSGGNVTLGSGGTITLGSGGTVTLGSGGNVTLGSGGVVALGSGGNITLGSGGTIALGSGGNVTLGSGGVQATELDYDTANSVVRAPELPTVTPTAAGQRVNWMPPAFGVVDTYTIYRADNGGTPVPIGTVTGNPPVTTFTDPNPLLVGTSIYTISTTVVPDTQSPQPRQSPPSPPAVVKTDQSIAFAPLPNVQIIDSPVMVTAVANSGLQVTFTTSGNCGVGSSGMSGGVSSASLTLTAAGNCTVTASQPGNAAFNAAAPVAQGFSITGGNSQLASQTISFAPLASHTFGDADFMVNATATSSLPVTFTAGGNCNLSGLNTVHLTGAGVCAVTASQIGNTSFSEAVPITQSFNIGKANAAITVTAYNVTYDGKPHVATATATGVGGVNLISSVALLTTHTLAGTYSDSWVFNDLSGNYSNTSGSLTDVINPAPATVSATPAGKTYGDSDPPLTATGTGFTSADASGLKLSATRAPGEAAGTYTITPVASGAVLANYIVTYKTATFTISKAVLTVTADNKSKTLDAANPTLTASYTGFKSGDSFASSVTGTPSLTTTATTTSPVGSYPITPSAGTLMASNYSFNFVNGKVTILYASGGVCDGAPGHVVLPPVDAGGKSVFKQGRTVPTQFRVCDANGVSIGTPGVVTSFLLTGIYNGTLTTEDDTVYATNNDAAFRWDSSNQQWIFNLSTANLTAGSTYIYTITLNDGTIVTGTTFAPAGSASFQFGLR